MNLIKMNVINLLQTSPGFTTSVRIFDYDYLLYVHAGAGSYKIGNRVYPAAAGDIFYCPPGVGNTIRADEDTPFLLSGIEFLAPQFRDSIPARASFLNHRFLSELIMEMVREYRYSRTGSSEICNALITALLENLVRLNDQSMHSCPPSEDLLEYLSENYYRPITHADLEKRFCYHKNTINRILKQQTGLSLKNYLIQLRIRKACELLKYSGESISRIADYCGYNSDIYFCRQFHEKEGMTPSQFRAAFGTPFLKDKKA